MKGKNGRACLDPKVKETSGSLLRSPDTWKEPESLRRGKEKRGKQQGLLPMDVERTVPNANTSHRDTHRWGKEERRSGNKSTVNLSGKSSRTGELKRGTTLLKDLNRSIFTPQKLYHKEGEILYQEGKVRLKSHLVAEEVPAKTKRSLIKRRL